jgi:YesN/AraC family two-component response regulator
MPIKVLLADDSELMRSAMRRTLEEEPRIEVVGEACSCTVLVQFFRARQKAKQNMAEACGSRKHYRSESKGLRRNAGEH